MSARLAYEYHLSHWSDIQDHLTRLYEAARGNCLEIGVRSGVSTSALLAGIEKNGGHLYSLDIADCRVFDGHPQWTFTQLDTVKGNAELPVKQWELALIDGDHTYEGALSDLQTFGPCSKRIFVHDTDAPDFPGVRKAVDEFVKSTNRKVIYHQGSYGMAEIQ